MSGLLPVKEPLEKPLNPLYNPEPSGVLGSLELQGFGSGALLLELFGEDICVVLIF